MIIVSKFLDVPPIKSIKDLPFFIILGVDVIQHAGA